jgi:hypothetical protein
MNRVCDYCGFVVWFTGLGYIVLWLIAAPEQRMLPPALHGAGLLAATFVCVRLIVLAIRRWRVPAAVARAPSVLAEPPPRRLPTVKPRDHFGLRGKPN